MIVLKSEKIGPFRIFTERDERGRVIKTVYLDFVPVVRFEQDNINERKLAAIELVERCRCSQTVAGKICGFHRNTVFKLLRIKKILGIEAIFEDDRGPKSPSKYIGKVRSYIKKLLRKHPDWSDQAIADRAAKYLKMEISRNAVARIRTEKKNKKRERNQPGRSDLIELAKEADAIERERYIGT
jgi:transposase